MGNRAFVYNLKTGWALAQPLFGFLFSFVPRDKHDHVTEHVNKSEIATHGKYRVLALHCMSGQRQFT